MRYLKNSSYGYVPRFGLSKRIDLFLEVDNDFLVFPLKDGGGFFRFQMDIFQKFAKFQQFGVAFFIDFELKFHLVRLFLKT